MASQNKVNEYYVLDRINRKLMKISSDFADNDCQFIFEIGSNGTGDDQFESPSGVCIDHEFVYTTDLTTNRVKKLKRKDLSFVAKIGSVGSGDNNFNSPRDITTDGQFLYITDEGNERIHKRRNSDLSLVTMATSVGRVLGITTDGDDVYATSADSFHIIKLNAIEAPSVLVVTTISNSISSTLAGICIDETHVWALSRDPNANVAKLLKNDLTAIVSQGSYGFSGFGISRDFQGLIFKNSSLNTDGYLRRGILDDLTDVGIKASASETGSLQCEFGVGINASYGATSYEFERFVNISRALNSKKVHHRTIEGALYSYNL